LGTGWRQESQPLDDMDLHRMQLLIDNAYYIGVRGAYSLEGMKQAGLRCEKVKILGDPGLAFDPDARKQEQVPALLKRQERQKVGGITERWIGTVIRQMSPVEIEQDKTTITTEAFYGRIAGISEYIIRIEGGTIFFFPLALPGRAYDNDHKAFHELKRLLPEDCRQHFHLCYGDNMAEALGQMDFVISQRLHGTLISLAQGVPCFPIEYQFGKLRDSLSVEGYDYTREMITPMSEVTLEKYIEVSRQDVRAVAKQSERAQMRLKYITTLLRIIGKVK